MGRWGGWCAKKRVLADGWSKRDDVDNGDGERGGGSSVVDSSRMNVIVEGGGGISKSIEKMGEVVQCRDLVEKSKILRSMLCSLPMRGRFVAESAAAAGADLPACGGAGGISVRPVISTDRKCSRRKQARVNIKPNPRVMRKRLRDQSDGVSGHCKKKVLLMDPEFSDDEKLSWNDDDMNALIQSIGRNVDDSLTGANAPVNAKSDEVSGLEMVGTSAKHHKSVPADKFETADNQLRDTADTDQSVGEQLIASQSVIKYKKAKAKTKHIHINEQHKNCEQRSAEMKHVKTTALNNPKERSKFYLKNIFDSIDLSVRKIEDRCWVLGKMENEEQMPASEAKCTNSSDEQAMAVNDEVKAQHTNTIFPDKDDQQTPSTPVNFVHSSVKRKNMHFSPSLEINQMQLEQKNQPSTLLENDTQKSAESEQQYLQSVQSHSQQLEVNDQQSVQIFKEDTPLLVKDVQSEKNSLHHLQSRIKNQMQLKEMDLLHSRARIRVLLQKNNVKDIFKNLNFFFPDQSFDTVSSISKTDSCLTGNELFDSSKETLFGPSSARNALHLKNQYFHILNEHFINMFFYQKDKDSIHKNIQSLVKIVERNIKEIEETLIILEFTEKKDKKLHTNWSAINHNILCSLCADNKKISTLSSCKMKNIDNYMENIEFMSYSSLREYFEYNRIDTFFTEYITLFKSFKSFKVLFSSEFRNFYEEIFQLAICQRKKNVFQKSYGPKVTLDLFHEQLHIFLETQFHSKILIFPEFHSLVFKISKKNVIYRELNNQTSLIIYFIFLSINLFFDSVCYNHPIDDLLTGDVDETEQRFLLSTISFTLRTLFIFPLLSYLDISRTSIARYHFLTFHIFRTEIDHFLKIENHSVSLYFKNCNMSIILAYNYQITANYFLNFVRYAHILQGTRKNILCASREIKNFKTFLKCLRIQNHPIMQSHEIKNEKLNIHDFILRLSYD